MAEINANPDINIDQEGGGGGGTITDAYNAKNRNGSDSGKVVDPSKFVYKNFPTPPAGKKGTFILDAERFPFVKVDSVYYVNDGKEWEYNSGNNTASLMDVAYCYVDDVFYETFSSEIPLKNSTSFLTDKIEGTISNSKGGMIPFYGGVQGHNALVTVENYRFGNRYLQGVASIDNYTTEDVELEKEPYSHTDRQRMLPRSDERGDPLYVHYYWDMITQEEIKKDNYLFASNFSEQNDSTNVFRIEVDSKGIINGYKNETKVLTMDRKWMPYLTIVAKQSHTQHGDLPLKISQYMDATSNHNFRWNKVYFNGGTINGKDYSPIDICVVGGTSVFDENFNYSGYKRVITINQATELNSLSIKLYKNTKIEFTKNSCTINDNFYYWDDLISKTKKQTNDTLIENFFYSKDYNCYLGNFKHMDEGKNLHNDGSWTTFVSDHHTYYGEDHVFTGYQVFLKGEDYFLRDKELKISPVELRSENNKYLQDFIDDSTNNFKIKNIDRVSPTMYLIEVNDFKINGESVKEKHNEDGREWQGCKVNILDYMYKVEGTCGSLDSEFFLTQNDLTRREKEEWNNGGEIYKEYNYWINELWLTESQAKDQAEFWYSSDDNPNGETNSNACSFTPDLFCTFSELKDEDGNLLDTKKYIACYRYHKEDGFLWGKDIDMVSYAGLRIGYETTPSTGWTVIASQNENSLEFGKINIGLNDSYSIYLKSNSNIGQYTAISTYGKKVRVDFVLKDGALNSYYVMPYASVDIPLKIDTILDYNVEIIEED